MFDAQISLEAVDLHRNTVSLSVNPIPGFATCLDGLGIQLQTFLLIGKEFLNIFTLVTLKLDHLAHLTINNDGAIASCIWCISPWPGE